MITLCHSAECETHDDTAKPQAVAGPKSMSASVSAMPGSEALARGSIGIVSYVRIKQFSGAPPPQANASQHCCATRAWVLVGRGAVVAWVLVGSEDVVTWMARIASLMLRLLYAPEV